VWAFAAGAAIPVMAILNAGLARALGGPMLATPALLFVGLFISIAMYFLLNRHLVGLTPFRPVQPRFLIGGAIVTFYIFTVTSLTPKFGVGNTVLFVVSAQVCTSVFIDAWGLFGAPYRIITPMRVIGLCVLLVGLVITQLGVGEVKHPS
jgi:bacterial/archaeal transporter family-2 protein